jgi:hypothetical protein
MKQQHMDEYEGTSSEYDEDGDEYDGHSQNEYSSENNDDDDDDRYKNNQIYPKKHDHQLEWDDEEMEYGPKKV